MKENFFDNMTPTEVQAYADLKLSESYRLLKQIEEIDRKLKYVRQKFGIRPRKIFLEQS